jgi:hypothetical protein
MRTHEQIIAAANGPSALARIVGVDAGTAKKWRKGDSIPAPYWEAIAEAKIATLEELAAAAATKQRAQPVGVKPGQAAL